jgi:5-formyltetrahydrofolate cyclo-ligase
MSPSTDEKAALRAELLAARSRLEPNKRRELSGKACLALIESEIFTRAKTIALYAPIKSEADPFGIEIAGLENGARIAYPAVEKDELKFFFAKRAELVPAGKYEIPEPRRDRHEAAAMDQIDLFIVPGVAFSAAGQRLGYGKGYYDRVLRYLRGGMKKGAMLAVGFTFGCLLRPTLPESPYDERVDALATEDGLIQIPPP